MKQKVLKLVVKYFNIKGFMSEMVADVLDEALEEMVQDSKNPYDNIAKASMYPVIEEKLLEVIDKKLDLEVILGLKDEAEKA